MNEHKQNNKQRCHFLKYLLEKPNVSVLHEMRFTISA